MKKSKIKEELTEIKELLKHVICQMQNLQSRIDQLDQDSMLWVSEYDDGPSGSSIGG
tara:strand:+ start:303 stop:473 length:171 start_codon:yes stop_codon:yes gene_type:complete